MSIMAYPSTSAQLLPFLPRESWDSLSTAELIRLNLTARAIIETGIADPPRLEVVAGYYPIKPCHILSITHFRLRRRFSTAFDGFASLPFSPAGGAV